jgi:ferric-dicitrate binding protein FerR (iron transport regulator)
MNADEMQTKEFEQRASAKLDESVTRVSARVRSRLNQARQTALAEVASHPRSFWRRPTFVPATGAVAAAALVALVLTAHFRADHTLPLAEGGQAFDDIEMLADTEGLDLAENDGNFYEWAAAQSDAGDGTSG